MHPDVTPEEKLQIEQLFEWFEKTKLPEKLKFSPCETITNMAKFYESHKAVITHNRPKMYRSYLDRLIKVQSIIKTQDLV